MNFRNELKINFLLLLMGSTIWATSLSASAAQQYFPVACAKTYDSSLNRKVEFKITINDPAPTAQQVDSIKSIITSINQNLAGYLNLPETIHLKISQSSNTAWHMAGSNEISVPFQELFTRSERFRQEWSTPKSKHPVFTQAIIAHEYGHALFEENITDVTNRNLIAAVPRLNMTDRNQHAQELAELNMKQEQLKKTKQEVVDQQKHLLDNPESFSMEVYGPLSDKVAKINRQIEELQGEFAKLLPLSGGLDIFTFNTPYSELYADIVAVLYSGKLSAVKDSLTFSGSTEEAQLIAKYRDFSADIKTKGWKNSEAHDLFAPTRSYLGKYIFSDPELRKNKSWLLNELTQVLTQEMISRTENSRLLTKASPEELNVRLIERLRSHFGAP